MKNSGKQIAVCAVTFALTVALGWLPYVFFVPLLFTCVTRGWKLTLIESLFFGVLSLLYSFAMPTSPVAAAFIENQWIPIVPRVLAGAGCHAVYVGLRRACKGGGRVAAALPVIAACAAGSILNTAMVLPCLLWTGGAMFGDATRAVFIVSTLISGCIELAVAVLVVPPLAITVGRALRLPDYGKEPVSVPPSPQE